MTTPLRERRRQMLRDEIVGAAQMLLAEKGHKSMSMDDLAAQVGVSKPTLYSYFGTKDEIVVAVAMRLINPLLLVLEADLIDQTPLERLTVFLATAVQLQIDAGYSALQIWVPEVLELLHAYEESAECLQRIDNAVVKLVQAAFDQGEIDPDLDRATVVRSLYALVHSMHLAPHSQSGLPDPATTAVTLAHIFRHGVRRKG